ncbi:hypothetical protein C9374_009424 [Naegleria lovaniensis]|uniref:Uncharacterized protein n=1 Tax=Naegleria lovaniensis TaxID=51637 RepID=A0AA88H4S1_NAELO|nr:uncharacterized protein C9374_009424 [Naegleria lovaniensis]KAG2392847.1 hypothetical protein C9374_009424 [Naegleria lovaniensis]
MKRNPRSSMSTMQQESSSYKLPMPSVLMYGKSTPTIGTIGGSGADDAQSASLNMGSTLLSHTFDEEDGEDDDDSSMASLSSEASASSIGQLYIQRNGNNNHHAATMTQNISTIGADSYSTLPPIQNVFYLGATNLYGNDNPTRPATSNINSNGSAEYPATLSLSVQEDPTFLNSFYDDGYCRPFKLRVRINDLSEKLPHGIYSGLVDSMTLLTLTKPYSMLSTKVIVREGTNNEEIGHVTKDLFKRNFSVKSNNKLLYKIVQDKNVPSTGAFSENYSIYEQKEKIGMMMVKKGKEFRLDVPPSLTPEDKALLLSAMILIVFTYYEDAKSQTFFAKNCKKKQYSHQVPPTFDHADFNSGFTTNGMNQSSSIHANGDYQQNKVGDLLPQSNRYL